MKSIESTLQLKAVPSRLWRQWYLKNTYRKKTINVALLLKVVVASLTCQQMVGEEDWETLSHSEELALPSSQVSEL